MFRVVEAKVPNASAVENEISHVPKVQVVQKKLKTFYGEGAEFPVKVTGAHSFGSLIKARASGFLELCSGICRLLYCSPAKTIVGLYLLSPWDFGGRVEDQTCCYTCRGKALKSSRAVPRNPLSKLQSC